ncbi:MAG: Npun_R1517 family heterocyst differentiation transcriptional regulator [Leptolyngbyaceae cyanobacterium SM1_1_3]|nr:Npun_R1517 family heterocyst differentiation transcriptional regulator [Leptolyngbyaceae cyanobacterium SM1_1_3]NJN04775.1 Npun_R1517 family heterocyst differentiation transcriptional regulator [Leptolyngbyaceae cyanobacterium RM1_1_2]
MNSSPTPTSNNTPGVYECEVHLKFRLIEEDLPVRDREQLIQMLVDAFAYGSDDYLETIQADVHVEELDELNASPRLRRQLIRLRNSAQSA